MTTPPTGDAPTPEQRLAALESAVGQLVGRVTRLEAALATRPAPPPPQPTPRPVAPPPLHVVPRAAATPTMPAATTPAFAAPPWLDLEQLVGRYGAIGFALLALLAGVGTFVSWAARQGLLGPELRVGGGYLLGVALAVVGVRLRGTRRTFANALLACALGCIHAASWGAGPRLHLVPSAVALAVVAAASGALAWLALREDEDVLFLFGAAGAAVAPFIVSDGGGQPLTLAFYGVLVFLAAAYGLGARPWHTALRLVLWIVPGYLGALASMPADAPSAAFAIPLFAAGLWAAALVA
ncbi:MAG TPA: DUF2339 domain-containing protein, partial [Gemmatimonadaceae bacterium]|nr:DUF2339 domain-containing protein [Gemmatimonadaceae bacterium]